MTTLAHFSYVSQTTINPDLTLVIVGAALDGPSKVPFTLNPNLIAYDYLGYSPLASAYSYASDAGAQNIILYRLNGTQATCTIQNVLEDGTTSDIISLVSVSASDIYNEIFIELTNDVEDPDQPATFLRVTDTSGNIRTYRFSDYPMAQDLVKAINLDGTYGLVEFTATAVDPQFTMKSTSSWASHFSGGDSGSSMIPDRMNGDAATIQSAVDSLKSAVKEALFGSFQEDQDDFEPNGDIGALDFGVLLLADMFYDDDAQDNFTQGSAGYGQIVGNFCLQKASSCTQGCIGVLGTVPLYSTDATSVQAKYDSLMPVSAPDVIAQLGFDGDSNSPQLLEQAVLEVDWRSHLQVVVGDTITTDALNVAQAPVSLAYAYAGTQTSIPYYTSMTNKTLKLIDKLSYEFDKDSVANLAGNGYISIVSSIRKGFVPYLATTFAGASLYSPPHGVRIGHQIGRTASNQLDSLIGTTVANVRVSAFQKKLDDMMTPFIDNRVIRQYVASFSLSQTDLRPYETQMLVSIQYTPFNEIQSLGTIVSMPFAGGVISQ